jgi:hypothetical protein
MARISYKNTRYLLAQDIRDFSYLALDLVREGGVPVPILPRIDNFYDYGIRCDTEHRG